MFRPFGDPDDSKANYYYGLIVIGLLIYIGIYSLTQ
jgi:hypothetical protein